MSLAYVSAHSSRRAGGDRAQERAVEGEVVPEPRVVREEVVHEDGGAIAVA